MVKTKFKTKRVATGKGYYKYRNARTGRYTSKSKWLRERKIKKPAPEPEFIEPLLPTTIWGFDIDYFDILDMEYT